MLPEKLPVQSRDTYFQDVNPLVAIRKLKLQRRFNFISAGAAPAIFQSLWLDWTPEVRYSGV
jgi:hypothetical protein